MRLPHKNIFYTQIVISQNKTKNIIFQTIFQTNNLIFIQLVTKMEKAPLKTTDDNKHWSIRHIRNSVQRLQSKSQS